MLYFGRNSFTIKNMNRKILATLALIIVTVALSGCQTTPSGMTQAEAQKIAEATCIKGGESLKPGDYNDNTKTWWFDANLNATKPGCKPACVVMEETKTAEVNWRCTGLIPSEEPVNSEVSEAIRQLFAVKYPEFAKTVSVKINQHDENHVRGSVSFGEGEPGGIFLAVKQDGTWKIVHDGNSGIPCELSSYGFPAEMLTDCSAS